MLGADFWRQRRNDRVGILAGLAFRGHAPAQVDNIVAHRDEYFRAADVTVAGNDDRRLPIDELGENLRPARPVDARVIRTNRGKYRKDPLFGNASGEEDALLR